MKSSPKLQIDLDSDLIDEDSLLSEEDLKKPQLPPGKEYSSILCPQLISILCDFGLLANMLVQLVIVKLELQEKPAKIALAGGLKRRRK